VAVIGAGPSGLAAAYFLARLGIPVTVFEKSARAGGVLTGVLPSYRLPPEVAGRDIAHIEQLGVELRLGAPAIFSLSELRAAGFKHVYVATGAEVARKIRLPGAGSELTALAFLRAFNEAAEGGVGLRREALGVGRRIAVVGGGNTAVDGARTARRLAGVEWVGIVYRRTQTEMPADVEELEAALAEGVELLPLLVPLSLDAGILRCRRMKLGAPGADGRRVAEPLDEAAELRVDTVISAIGETTDALLLREAGLETDPRGSVAVDPRTQETTVPEVFSGGDAVRGGGTVILSMADARRAAREIARRLEVPWVEAPIPGSGSPRDEVEKRSHVLPSVGATADEVVRRESLRCLSCDLVCNRCVEVCPNRANVAISVPGFRDRTQILHLEELCNDCGTCATFCLYEGMPHRDKLTLFASLESFHAARGPGFVVQPDGLTVCLRAGGGEIAARVEELATAAGGNTELRAAEAIARAVLLDHPYLVPRRGP
jgi:putative selenate reductase